LTLSWLKEWACSRSFGLGTRLPWDPQFVIESLSDSTIYMAYYTFAHLLHNGSLDGSTRGVLAPEDLTDAVWDYVLLGAAAPTALDPSKTALLARMKAEFEYWYPLDLRVSGKDLIQNHLTMSLYNHAAIWGGAGDTDGRLAPPHRMPQGFFCNGHVLVDGEKMSKSKVRGTARASGASGRDLNAPPPPVPSLISGKFHYAARSRLALVLRRDALCTCGRGGLARGREFRELDGGLGRPPAHDGARLCERSAPRDGRGGQDGRARPAAHGRDAVCGPRL
jgi:hypothetical protein